MNPFRDTIDRLSAEGNLRSIPRSGLGHGMVDLSSNDYLGLATRTDLQEEFYARPGATAIPMSSSASRLLAGRQEEYSALEELLSELYARPCLLFNSGYHAITGLVSSIGAMPRTLIVADEGSYVSYLEGCTAPRRDENQLHAAVVEIVVERDAEVKYSTVQNWYPGDREGRGGIYNFVTKRGLCRENARLSWTQVETGSSITWKYPSCVLAGDNSVGEFYSVAMTNNFQQADTGTKMIHLGKNSSSTIVSKGISAGYSQNSYRGLVKVAPEASGCRNYTQCDSLLMGSHCGALTFPYIDILNDTAIVEHEATTSKISEDQLFYCNQRGIPTEEAVALIVNGYAREVMNKLPMEFAVEAQKLLQISLEGSVG